MDMSHGGEERELPRKSIRDSHINNKITNKKLVKNRPLLNKKSKLIKKEFNVLDAILTDDILSSTSLRNDVHNENFQNELNPNKKNSCKNGGDTRVRIEPTSVTLVNLLGGKKHRKITYEGLRVLLDTGCSDSLLRARYAKIGEEKPIKNIYSTGNGNISTSSQSTIFLPCQNLVTKNY